MYTNKKIFSLIYTIFFILLLIFYLFIFPFVAPLGGGGGGGGCPSLRACVAYPKCQHWLLGGHVVKLNVFLIFFFFFFLFVMSICYIVKFLNESPGKKIPGAATF
jgi:hypothetical protein